MSNTNFRFMYYGGVDPDIIRNVRTIAENSALRSFIFALFVFVVEFFRINHIEAKLRSDSGNQ